MSFSWFKKFLKSNSKWVFLIHSSVWDYWDRRLRHLGKNVDSGFRVKPTSVISQSVNSTQSTHILSQSKFLNIRPNNWFLILDSTTLTMLPCLTTGKHCQKSPRSKKTLFSKGALGFFVTFHKSLSMASSGSDFITNNNADILNYYSFVIVFLDARRTFIVD